MLYTNPRPHPHLPPVFLSLFPPPFSHPFSSISELHRSECRAEDNEQQLLNQAHSSRRWIGRRCNSSAAQQLRNFTQTDSFSHPHDRRFLEPSSNSLPIFCRPQSWADFNHLDGDHMNCEPAVLRSDLGQDRKTSSLTPNVDKTDSNQVPHWRLLASHENPFPHIRPIRNAYEGRSDADEIDSMSRVRQSEARKPHFPESRD